MDFEEARAHLDLAKEQWEKAATAWWEPSDPASCVTNAFYSYENLIVALAEAQGRRWEPSHYKKAALAGELFKAKILQTDVSDTILHLNDLRKDVSYGEPGEELGEADLEAIVSNLESFIEEVETIVETLEQEADEVDDEDESDDC